MAAQRHLGIMLVGDMNAKIVKDWSSAEGIGDSKTKRTSEGGMFNNEAKLLHDFCELCGSVIMNQGCQLDRIGNVTFVVILLKARSPTN